MTKVINPKQKLVTPRRIKNKVLSELLMILASEDGESEWKPVHPRDVPAFVKRRDIVRRMLDGEIVQLESVSRFWYRAMKVSKQKPAATVIH